MPRTGSQTVRVGFVLALCALAACGTRLPDTAFEQAAGPAASAPAPDARAATGPGGTTPVADAAPAPDAVAGSPGTTPAADASRDAVGGPTGATPNGAGATAGPNRASDVGVTPTSITLGNITAGSGVLGDTFLPALRGLQAWVAATNARGGINGRRIVLVSCDDREDRARSLACAKKLVEQDRVFAFLANNTRAEGGHAPYVDAAGVPVINTPISNAAYRFPHYWTIYGTGYPRDGKTVGWKGKLINTTAPYRWFKEKLGARKAAVFYYDLAESQQAGKWYAKGLALEGFEVTEFPINFANPNFDQPAAQMRSRGIEVVFDSIDDGANRKLCDAMSRNGFVPKAKVSTIVAMGQSVGSDLPRDCRNVVYVTHDSANAWDTANPVVRAFRADFARYKPRDPLHQWALEGWAIGRLFGEALAAMGPAPTRAGLEAWLRGLDDYTGGGLWNPMDWRPANYDVPTMKDCVAVSRWQDAGGGFVTQAPPGTCYPDAKLVATDPAEQGD
jgi:branched-chain amino acid transport system substrate-binding protein